MITHDSWQRIKEIFQSAQELTAADRVDFLNRACGDDAALREEVEALLTADDSNNDFLLVPAYEFAASLLADGSEFVAGQKIGPYTILCPLGSGGMGQIYLAEDAKLRRKIAIKLISEEFASDPRRVRRFELEALAASALNHPNICVIYQVEKTENGRHFITMEYIQGVTLREQMSRGALPVLKALNIAIQVSAALASAHATGIVHRDIKPENIMLRPDGYVKVLDFGLAKLTEVIPGPNELSTNLLTETGTLMGTVKYMSPEQLRETKVDERSDIWSLGIVLHEMLTGKTPFDKPTSNETVATILSPQPAPLKLSSEIPAHLREIIAKSLEKDSSARYQTVMKFASDLRQVQINQQRLGRKVDSPVGVGDELTGLFTRLKSQAILRTELLFSEIRSHKRAAIFAGATGVLALLLLLPSVTRFINNILSPPPPVQAMQRITTEGTSVCAAISSDGKLVAHAEDRAGKQSLVITNTATSASSVVVPPMEVKYLGVTFTRDNNYLYFTRRENNTGIVYRLALPGSSPVKVKEGVDGPISLSPEEDRFAFVRLDKAKGYSLMVSTIDGRDDKVIKARQDNEGFSVNGLAWSPDGNLIVCPATSWTDKGYRVDLVGFDLKTADPQPQPISTNPWFAVLQVAWRADMSSLVISARNKATAPYQLWEIAYPSGAVQRLTNDLAEYRGVSLAHKNILTVRNDRKWKMFVADKVADNYEPRSVVDSGEGLSYGITWAGNDKIVYSSMVRDLLNISRINPDGSNRVQLTVDAGDNYTPAATADGKFVVFASNRTGSFNIWRMNAQDGSDLKQLTFKDSNFYPSVSADNKWVVFDNQSVTKLSIWKVPFDGGDETKIAEGYRMPAYSPDSQFIAARYDLDSGTSDLAIFAAEGGQQLRNVPIPVLDWQRVQWLTANTVTYVKSVDGYSDIWSYDLATGATRKLTKFNGEQIFAYAWSPDQQRLAYQLGTYWSNVVLIGSDQ